MQVTRQPPLLLSGPLRAPGLADLLWFMVRPWVLAESAGELGPFLRAC